MQIEPVLRRFGEILVKGKMVTADQYKSALREQLATGQFIGEVLVARGYATEEQVAKALAWQLRVPLVSLGEVQPEQAAIDRVPRELARRHTCFPVKLMGRALVVALHNPLDDTVQQELTTASGMKLVPVVAARTDVIDAILKYYGPAPAPQPTSTKELAKAVMAHARALDRAEAKRRSVSIISNKGGVGKTHTATNIAFCLAHMGHKVLLIDADFSNADVSNKLNLFPDATLFDLLTDQKPVHEIITPTRFGFDLIAGKTGRFRLANLTDEQRLRLIQSFNEVGHEHDVVVMDLGAGLSPQVLDFALATDETVIATTPRDILAGYACTKVSFIRFVELEMALASGIQGYEADPIYRPRILITQVTRVADGQGLFDRIDSTARTNLNRDAKGFEVQCQYLGCVARDNDRHCRAEMDKAPFTQLFPKRAPAKCYVSLAKRLLDGPQAPVPESKQKNRFLRSAEMIRRNV